MISIVLYAVVFVAPIATHLNKPTLRITEQPCDVWKSTTNLVGNLRWCGLTTVDVDNTGYTSGEVSGLGDEIWVIICLFW